MYRAIWDSRSTWGAGSEASGTALRMSSSTCRTAG